jgi:hypothetical protein
MCKKITDVLGAPCCGCRRDEQSHTSQFMPPDLTLRKDEDEDGHENENTIATTARHSSFPPAHLNFDWHVFRQVVCSKKIPCWIPKWPSNCINRLAHQNHIDTLTIK